MNNYPVHPSREEPESRCASQTAQPPKLLDQVRSVIRVKHYSIRTEESYVGWIRRFILFHGKQHPRDLGPEHVRAFLTYLAVEEKVSAATQNQALNAIVFLYRHVLDIDFADCSDFERAKTSRKKPVVLTREEVDRLIAAMDGQFRLMALLLYGGGLRLMDCLRLRVKDLDFGYHQIIVRDGKGAKDRIQIVQELLGHADVATTEIYTHVLNRPGLAVRSPADTMVRLMGSP